MAVLRLNKLKEYSETSKWNYEVNNNSKVGVITHGMSFEFAQEALGETVDYLKLGFTYPLPEKMITEFCDKHETGYLVSLQQS